MSSEFKIIINLEDLCAWMPINNSFTFDRWNKNLEEEHNIKVKKGEEGPPFWRGVLIQLGKYQRARDHKYYKRSSRGEMDVLDEQHAITFLSGSSPIHVIKKKTIIDKDIWINIVPEKPHRFERPVPVICNPDDKDVKEEDDEVQYHLFGVTNPGNRPFPLRENFKPYQGGITFWHDVESGYDVKVRQDAHKKPKNRRKRHWEEFGSHCTYVFSLKDGPYEVKIYEDWRLKTPSKIEKVDTISVSPDAHSRDGDGHGTHMDPPRKIGT